MKIKLFTLSASLLLIFSGCEKDSVKPNHEPKTIKLPANASEVITKSNDFGINLFKITASVEDGNMMLSPLSASVALTMLLNGCGSNTYNQIQGMLNFNGLTTSEINKTYKSLVEQLLNADPNIKLAIANAIWYRHDFQVKPPFLDTMSTNFSAHVEGLDFSLPSALTTMNQWASDNTYGKIPQVLNEISPDAVMFLMNALYFKGTWTYQFDNSLTSSDVFYLENGNSTSVDMMHGVPQARVYRTNDYSAIELTYGRTNYSMVIIVPSGTLASFLSTFDNIKWGNLIQSLNAIETPSSWNVSLPKFKFSYGKVLKDQLKSMGMVDAFDPNVADLSGISDANLFVNFLKQNTFVEVNEEGTEAAAVTIIGIDTAIAGGNSNEFSVNKPFVFAIRERTTNTILFMGKVVNPSL